MWQLLYFAHETKVVFGDERSIIFDFEAIWDCFMWSYSSLLLAFLAKEWICNNGFLRNGRSESVQVIMGRQSSLLVKTITIASCCLVILWRPSGRHVLHEHPWGVGRVRGATSLLKQGCILARCQAPRILLQLVKDHALRTRVHQLNALIRIKVELFPTLTQVDDLKGVKVCLMELHT